MPLLVSACTGTIESANLVGLPPEEQLAQQAWVEKALPVLSDKCISCHGGAMPNIAYIGGEDDLVRRETLITYVPRVVNLGAPASSRMLSKGDHTATGGGPALDITEANAILIWIKVEAKARPDTNPPIRTAQVTPMVCTAGNPGDPTCPINTIDLSSVGAAGATLSFVVQPVGTDSYFTNVKVKAGADGIYLEHPLIETYANGEVDPTPDPLDRFFATTVNLMANAEGPLGTGTFAVVGFKATDPITLKFDVVDKYRPGT